MKKVIGGKVYNTDTADVIGSWSNNLSNRDFSACEEALYKTKKGQFFLHGEGGGLTKWATSHDGGNCRGAGADIVLMTEAEAREWAEGHLDADEIEAAFKVEEG